MHDVSMTLSQLELALLGGLPLRKLDQLIARGHAPIYARPQSRRVACYTLHEAIMLVIRFPAEGAGRDSRRLGLRID